MIWLRSWPCITLLTWKKKREKTLCFTCNEALVQTRSRWKEKTDTRSPVVPIAFKVVISGMLLQPRRTGLKSSELLPLCQVWKCIRACLLQIGLCTGNISPLCKCVCVPECQRMNVTHSAVDERLQRNVRIKAFIFGGPARMCFFFQFQHTTVVSGKPFFLLIVCP